MQEAKVVRFSNSDDQDTDYIDDVLDKEYYKACEL